MNRRPAAATVNEPSPRAPARSTTPGTCRNWLQRPGGPAPWAARAPEEHAVSARPSARLRQAVRRRWRFTRSQVYGIARRYLLPAGNPRRGDDRVLPFGPDGGEEPELADAHGQFVVLRLEAE